MDAHCLRHGRESHSVERASDPRKRFDEIMALCDFDTMTACHLHALLLTATTPRVAKRLSAASKREFGVWFKRSGCAVPLSSCSQSKTSANFFSARHNMISSSFFFQPALMVARADGAHALNNVLCTLASCSDSGRLFSPEACFDRAAVHSWSGAAVSRAHMAVVSVKRNKEKSLLLAWLIVVGCTLPRHCAHDQHPVPNGGSRQRTVAECRRCLVVCGAIKRLRSTPNMHATTTPIVQRRCGREEKLFFFIFPRAFIKKKKKAIHGHLA